MGYKVAEKESGKRLRWEMDLEKWALDIAERPEMSADDISRPVLSQQGGLDES